MSRFRRAGLAAFAAGALFLGACSSDDSSDAAGEGSPATAAETTSAPKEPGIGDRVEAEGIALTIDEVTEATQIDWYDYDEEHPGGTRESRDGGKFVLVEATVENTWNKDIQPSCYDVDVTLFGDNDAEYGPITDNPMYPDNAGCSEHLGAGFDEEATYVFEVPDKVTPTKFAFFLAAAEEPSPEPGVITIDGVKAGVSSDRPNPSSESKAPETTDNATTQATTTTQQQAATSPALGAPCAASQANQPGTAADGTPLVCVNMGASGFSWVSGPSPQGVGTASDGGSCVDGDVGGQDEQGRMMMCVNGEWVYGP